MQKYPIIYTGEPRSLVVKSPELAYWINHTKTIKLLEFINPVRGKENVDDALAVMDIMNMTETDCAATINSIMLIVDCFEETYNLAQEYMAKHANTDLAPDGYKHISATETGQTADTCWLIVLTWTTGCEADAQSTEPLAVFTGSKDDALQYSGKLHNTVNWRNYFHGYLDVVPMPVNPKEMVAIPQSY